MNGLIVAVLVCWGAVPQPSWPSPDWPRAAADEVGMDATRLAEARQYALSGSGSGYVLRHGKLVMAWGSDSHRYDLKSSTKAIGVTALGLALADGKMKLDDRAIDYQPALGVPPESNRTTGWLGQITLLHLATQTAGFDKPGGYEPLLFRPGTRWHYSDGGPNWLAECITLAYRRDVDELLFDRVFTPIGIGRDDLAWRKNAYRPHEIDGIARREFGSGISANVDAMARIGYLYLRRGRWHEQQILPESFVDAASHTVASVVGLPEQDPERYGNASDHYGLLWWNNRDGTLARVPRDAYWSWGLYDSLIVVIPSLDVVVARAGKSWPRTGGRHYDVLAPFFEPIAESVVEPAIEAAPYPPSPVIRSVAWTPPDSIIRLAPGSDNWPITWADDGALYTAYGDGWGFDPRVPKKLSLGLAELLGSPGEAGPAGGLSGVNIRSPTGEQTGDGARGKKASGMLMVDGVLYMLVRNAANAELACSADHARTWTTCPWRFQTSFGCPTFLNFGPDYREARDEFVYIYSPDADSAYRPADRMVLARVRKDRLKDHKAYEFFERLNESGRPVWTADVARRGAVFSAPGQCGRSSVSYNAPLGRYLWVQVLPGQDRKESMGLAIYDAPEPWGPWTTAAFSRPWDVPPGDTAGLPTKWISDDGKTLFLVFSGGDSFSVRKAVLVTASESP